MTRKDYFGEKRYEKKVRRSGGLLISLAILFIATIIAAVVGFDFLFPCCSIHLEELGKEYGENSEFQLPTGYWATKDTERIYTIHAWDGSSATFTYDGTYLHSHQGHWFIVMEFLVLALLLGKVASRFIPVERINQFLIQHGIIVDER